MGNDRSKPDGLPETLVNKTDSVQQEKCCVARHRLRYPGTPRSEFPTASAKSIGPFRQNPLWARLL